METLGGILVLASLAAFVLGVVNVIRPQGWMRVRKRLVGLFIVLGSLGSCVAGAAMLPPPDVEATQAAPKAEEAASKPPRNITDRPEKAPPALKTSGLTQAEFDGMWAGVKRQMERCDAPVRRAGEVVGTGNAYAAFRPVKAASDACREAWLGIDRIEIPRSAKGDVKKALRDARERCSTAAVVKKEAMDRMAKVLDGDDKPSSMAALQDSLKRGTDLSTGCWLGFLAAATEADLEMPEFKDAN